MADALADVLNSIRPMPRLADLLAGVQKFLCRFVVLSDAQAIAITLWVFHTHTVAAGDVSPYLAVTSPEKRSGKTRLLEVLELLVARPWRVITPSEAVLFRKIAAAKPTVLLDEADAIFKDRGPTYEGLRALLNAGHRCGVVVSRCVGEGAKQQLVDFPVFCPKAIAGIGSLPDTVADRSIRIRLARRAPHEQIERFRYRDIAQEGAALAQVLGEATADAIETLRDSRPAVPKGLNDRAGECWEPLFAIADFAGGNWPQRARAAAVALQGDDTSEGTLGETLLAAIYGVFDERGADRLSTADLLRGLVDRDDGPWPEWWGSKVAAGEYKGPGHRLARLLKPFGISRRKLRIGEAISWGYDRVDFSDAFGRYVLLPPSPEAPKKGTREQPAPTAAAIDAPCTLVPFLPPSTEDGKRGESWFPGDDGRRTAFVSMGALLGWPGVDKDGIQIPAGRTGWLDFARRSDDETIVRALEVIQ